MNATVDAVDEQWAVDFVSRTRDVGGFVRLARVGERCWYWCYLTGAPLGLVAVRDHEVVPPRRAGVLEIRADSLWAELVCETRGEHWSIGLEAFGVRLEEPIDAWTTEIGERVAVGLDLEWEVGEVEPFGVVHGVVLLERDRVELEGWGVLAHATTPDTAWPTEWTGWCRSADGRWSHVVGGSGAPGADGIVVPTGIVLADGSERACRARGAVPVPLGPEPARGAPSKRGPALVRVLVDVAPSGDPVDDALGAAGEVTGTGWVEVLQS